MLETAQLAAVLLCLDLALLLPDWAAAGVSAVLTMCTANVCCSVVFVSCICAVLLLLFVLHTGHAGHCAAGCSADFFGPCAAAD
jgi:hypothetical protein